jgi:small subunit ribosomal protein S20
MKTDKKRAARNNYVKRTLKTLAKQMDTEAKLEDKQQVLSELYSQLYKADKKGVIHKRTASRRKARLAAALNKSKA